jgi:hypothetical protein
MATNTQLSGQQFGKEDDCARTLKTFVYLPPLMHFMLQKQGQAGAELCQETNV